MLWLGAIVLLLQLFALGGHDHEDGARSQECVACSVQAQSHGAPPVARIAPATMPPMLVRVVAPGSSASPAHARTSHMLPQPHAPPALTSFA